MTVQVMADRAVTVWLARPEGSAVELVQRLQGLGATVLHVPVMEIQPLPPSHPALQASRPCLEAMQSYHHVIFISTHAVRHGMPLIQACQAAWPEGTACYAIGRATAQLLAEFGVEARQPLGPVMNSEALLQLPQLRSPGGEKVLIVRGIGGREYLAQSLRERGAAVDYLEAYRRVKSGTLPETISRRIGAGTIDYILAASGETINNAVELVGRELQPALVDIPIVVPGQRVADIARRAGFKRVIEAINAGDVAMIEAIVQATQQQG